MFPHHVIDMRSPAICEENFNSCQRHTQWKNLQHCTNGSFPLMSSLCITFVWGYVCLCKHLCVSCRITVTFVTALEPRTTECNSGTSVPWFQYQHRCFPGSFDPKWFENLYMYLTPVQSQFLLTTFLHDKLLKNLWVENRNISRQNWAAVSMFCFCMPSGSGYVLSRFRPV